MAKKSYEELVITLQNLQFDDIVTTSPVGTNDNDGAYGAAWN